VNRARRCLLVEGLSYHWEVLPPWVGMLQHLGYDVEVAAGSSSGHRETLTLLQSRVRTHQAAEVQNLPLDDFDFVVLNSLVHEETAAQLEVDPGSRASVNQYCS
jgi:hypothetical protein